MPDLSPLGGGRRLQNSAGHAGYGKLEEDSAADPSSLPLAAQNLLVQDLRGNNQEKSYRAQFWLAELKLNVPGVTSDEEDRAAG